MSRFQFVWWGWRWQFGLFTPEGSMRLICRWSLCFGPLEIRRWETSHPAPAKEEL